MHDIHTHLYWDSYDADRDAVIARAHAAGVETMFVIGCTVEESRQAVALAEKYPVLYASVGIHPHEYNARVGRGTQDELRGEIGALRKLAQSSKKIVAIGECGLDYYVRPVVVDPEQVFVGRQAAAISEEAKTVQRQGFLTQIALARELGLPLIVHCRPSAESDDAYRDMLEILKANSQKLKAGILHCYMGDTDITEKLLDLPNIFFSFTGNITYPVKQAIIGTKDDLTETVKRIPLDRLFVETDCPFLAPQAKRGERNEPAHVTLVADAVARLHGVDRTIVDQMVADNARRVFGHGIV